MKKTCRIIGDTTVFAVEISEIFGDLNNDLFYNRLWVKSRYIGDISDAAMVGVFVNSLNRLIFNPVQFEPTDQEYRLILDANYCKKNFRNDEFLHSGTWLNLGENYDSFEANLVRVQEKFCFIWRIAEECLDFPEFSGETFYELIDRSIVEEVAQLVLSHIKKERQDRNNSRTVGN